MEANQSKPKAYSYVTHKRKVRLRILDGMDSICMAKGPRAQERSRYYDSYDLQRTDPTGSYTGVPNEVCGEEPVQDVDDL